LSQPQTGLYISIQALVNSIFSRSTQSELWFFFHKQKVEVGLISKETNFFENTKYFFFAYAVIKDSFYLAHQ
jgi:hypothetical protein